MAMAPQFPDHVENAERRLVAVFDLGIGAVAAFDDIVRRCKKEDSHAIPYALFDFGFRHGFLSAAVLSHKDQAFRPGAG